MTVRFDESARRIELAVADLLEPQLLRSIGFANRGGFERMWLGQAIHGRYQEAALAADPSYRREVVIEHRFDHRGWRVHLSGRIDGLRRDPSGGLVIEEIKSVRREGQLAATAREIYERQALLYAWMTAESRAEPVRAELVLIAIGSDTVERLELESDFAALEVAIRKRLNAILGGFESERRAAADRRAAGETISFPYGAPRSGQEEILAAVDQALAQREHLLLEAPTGIGKTVAALFPAVRFALREGKRVFVLTAKNLQQDMAVKVLRLLETGGAFRALRMRAKTRMCANGEVICHEEYCPFARDYAAKLAGTGLVQRLLADERVLEPDLVFSAAAAAEVCPFEISLDLAQRAQVVVADYNYAFDPYVALTDFAPDADLSDTVLVIDEIHNLVERGRGYLSPELSAAAARRAAEEAARGGAPIHDRLERLALELAFRVESAVDGALAELPDGDGALEMVLPEDALWRLRSEFDAAFVDYLEHQRETKSFRAEDPFVGLYFDFLRFLAGLPADGEAFSRLGERRGGDRLLRIFCKDPSAHLGGVLARVHSAIGLSATLSPPEFYRDLLGFESRRTAALSVPSPFPPERRRLVIDAAVTTLWRERAGNTRPIADRLAAFAEAVPGNCLALFPSFQFLADVAAHLAPRGKRVLVQQRTHTEREREALLETLRGALLGDVLMLAVAGGVFAEGVDYPGDMLRAVAVIGPCLPVPTLDTRLLQSYYEERFERGFEYAFVVPGMTRVVQAAGRLIRSSEDAGVIALFDRRFLDRPYADHLPADWIPSAGPEALSGDPGRVAKAFFRELAGGLGEAE
ncbi:MAG: helicase C-terminal domain-containing protein [Thermoanaerobaculia bacterium]